MINAGDVQRAYTLPLDGLMQGLQYSDQLTARRQAQQRADQNQASEDEYRKLGLIDRAFEGTDIGTGTPYDEISSAHVSQAHGNMLSAMRANPNMSPTEIYMMARDQTRGITSGIAQAKKIDSLINDYTTRSNKEYGHIDQTLLKQDLLDRAFRDQDGNTLTTPNLEFYKGIDLSTPAGRAPYLNPVATAEATRKELYDNFKPTEVEPYQDPRFPGAIMQGGKTRAYLDKEGQYLTDPVSWSAPNPVGVNTLPATSLFQPYQFNASVPVQPAATEKKFAGTPPAVLDRLKGNPVFGDALELETRRLKREYGSELRGAKPEQIEQIAAHNLVSTYGSREGVEYAKPSYDVAKYFSDLSHKQTMEGLSKYNAMLHGQSVNLASRGQQLKELQYQEKHIKQAQAAMETVPMMLSLAHTPITPETKPADAAAIKHAQLLEQNNTTPVDIGLGYKVKSTNLSTWHGAPLFRPGSKQPVSLKTVDLGGGRTVLLETPQRYNKVTKLWEDNPAGANIYGHTSQLTSRERMALSRNGHLSDRSMADVLQTYDKQWLKGQKGDNNTEFDKVFENDPAEQYAVPEEEN